MIYNPLIKVGMAELEIMNGKGVISTVGLGSCVGVVIYDQYQLIAGLVHIMLPSSDIARDVLFNQAKYADTAIPLLLEKLRDEGANLEHLKAKLAGGSQMFMLSPVNNDTMRIGPRNTEACKRILQHHAIPITGEDCGGNYGRTIEFHTDVKKLIVRSVNQVIKEI